MGPLRVIKLDVGDGKLVSGSAIFPEQGGANSYAIPYKEAIDNNFTAYFSWGSQANNIPTFGMHIQNAEKLIVAAKLELGPQQTLAHQDAEGNWVLNDPPPNKAAELLKCQRYMLVLHNTNSSSYGAPAYGAYDSISKTLPVNFPIPVAMRANPSVTCAGTWYIRGGGVTKRISPSVINASGGVAHSNIVTVGLDASNMGLPDSDQVYILISVGDQTSKIIFDANL